MTRGRLPATISASIHDDGSDDDQDSDGYKGVPSGALFSSVSLLVVAIIGNTRLMARRTPLPVTAGLECPTPRLVHRNDIAQLLFALVARQDGHKPTSCVSLNGRTSHSRKWRLTLPQDDSCSQQHCQEAADAQVRTRLHTRSRGS